jgi:hypothetical protein
MSNKDDKLKKPEDVRRQISQWISYACSEGRLPFEKDGGVIVQMLNTLLKCYETTKIADIEERLAALETEKQNVGGTQIQAECTKSTSDDKVSA